MWRCDSVKPRREWVAGNREPATLKHTRAGRRQPRASLAVKITTASGPPASLIQLTPFKADESLKISGQICDFSILRICGFQNVAIQPQRERTAGPPASKLQLSPCESLPRTKPASRATKKRSRTNRNNFKYTRAGRSQPRASNIRDRAAGNREPAKPSSIRERAAGEAATPSNIRERVASQLRLQICASGP